MGYKFVLIFLCLLSSFGRAKVFQLESTLPEKSFRPPRWMYTQDLSPKTGVKGQLWKVKKAWQNGKWAKCLQAIKRVRSKAKGLEDWLIFAELSCLLKTKMSKSENRQRLGRVLESIDGNSSLVRFFISNEVTLPTYTKAQFLSLQSEVKFSRKRAWKRVQQIQKLNSRLNPKQKGQLYKTAGDLAFVEQNLLGAWDFYKRSLAFDDRKDLRKKIELIKKSLNIKPPGTTEDRASAASNELAIFSREELALVDQMKDALKAKDYVSAVQDGTEIIENYPGSEWADWASDQILKVYLGVVNKPDKRYSTVRKKILRTMKSADGKRLHRWARNAWARGAYKDVVFLVDIAAQKIQPHPDERKLLLLGGNSAVSAGDYSSAGDFYKRLTKKFAGTPQAIEGVFRLGLLYFREKDYSRAASQFEKLLANNEIEDFRLESLYWSWRSYQEEKRKGAIEYAQQLVSEYPLTYYGLRARAETSEGQLGWRDEETRLKKLAIEMSFTEYENQSREKFLLLLQSGWLKEARVELSNWPKPITPEQKLLYASYWGSSLNHYTAIKLINEAWEGAPGLRGQLTISQAFPKEFARDVEREAKSYGLNSSLIYALIRQESSFRPDVVSPANAAGLMQIVPVTAKDIARFIKWKGPLRIPEDMFKPSQNIKFGTSYLKRMVRAFDGHLPLALAAYNAGIGRMRRWLSARSDIEVDEEKLTSAHRAEMWIDELPWGETRYYVKSILRNYLIYQWLEASELRLGDPVWVVQSTQVD